MSLTSFDFLLFLFCSAVLLRLPLRYPGRDLRLASVNAVFVTQLFRATDQARAALFFMGLGYLCLCGVRLIRGSKALFGAVFLVLSAFIWLKQYGHVLPYPRIGFLNLGVSVVGLSYILFRVLRALVDCEQGMARFPSPLRFANYCLFFPCFLSGPIMGLPSFDRQMSEPLPPLTIQRLNRGIASVTQGFALILVCSAVLARATDWAQTSYYHAEISREHVRWLAVAAVFYTTYLYANFSGYMRIVIGAGTICGFEVPENFNRPFASASFFELWSRWHITLSDWFKNYLFNPLLKQLMGRWTGKVVAPWLGVLAFFVTFFIMGLWHGTTRLFAIYGLLLGFGAAVNKAWQILMTRLCGKKGVKALAERPWYRRLGNALTLGYFSLALCCLWLEPGRINHNPRLPFAGVCPIALLLATAIYLVYALVYGLVYGWAASLSGRALRGLAPSMARFGTLSLDGPLINAVYLSFIVYALIVTGDTAPEFVYKAF